MENLESSHTFCVIWTVILFMYQMLGGNNTELTHLFLLIWMVSDCLKLLLKVADSSCCLQYFLSLLKLPDILGVTQTKWIVFSYDLTALVHCMQLGVLWLEMIRERCMKKVISLICPHNVSSPQHGPQLAEMAGDPT